MNKKLNAMLGFICTTAVIFGSFYAFDNTYARDSELLALEDRTLVVFQQFSRSQEIKDRNAAYRALLEQKYTYKALLKRDPTDIDIQETYQEILDNLKRIKAELAELNKIK